MLYHQDFIDVVMQVFVILTDKFTSSKSFYVTSSVISPWNALMVQHLWWLTCTYMLNIKSVRLREKKLAKQTPWAPPSLYIIWYLWLKGGDEKVAAAGKIWQPIVRWANRFQPVAPLCLLLWTHQWIFVPLSLGCPARLQDLRYATVEFVILSSLSNDSL